MIREHFSDIYNLEIAVVRGCIMHRIPLLRRNPGEDWMPHICLVQFWEGDLGSKPAHDSMGWAAECKRHCADPHPGNIAVDGEEEGRLIYYDFGMMGTIPGDVREGLLELFYGVYQKDPDRHAAPSPGRGMAWHGMAWHGMAWHGMPVSCWLAACSPAPAELCTGLRMVGGGDSRMAVQVYRRSHRYGCAGGWG